MGFINQLITGGPHIVDISHCFPSLCLSWWRVAPLPQVWPFVGYMGTSSNNPPSCQNQKCLAITNPWYITWLSNGSTQICTFLHLIIYYITIYIYYTYISDPMFCEIPLVPGTVPAASPVDCLDTTELSRSAFEPLSWRRLQSVHAESSSKQRNRKCHLENMAIVHP
jgi:hypothetical protein